MDEFAQVVNNWHDFYLMVGTAAATLIGLLFVSLSVNPDVIALKENANLRTLATQTFVNFMIVLMLAVVFLIPDQGPQGLGLPMLGIDCFGLYLSVRRFLRVLQGRPRAWGRGSFARRFALPVICFGALMIVSVSVLLGNTGGLYWLVPVMIILLLDASLNAWNMLLQFREPRAGS